ncbi:SusC/RagA family TonB-linked outer membrane protein [Flavisolibacter tropicus]|nr:SusC/RagA family TonB-linked outer membrane protein [Flavisolibacter tropicus]
MRKLLLCAWVLLLGITSWAQQAITGTVVDASNNPLSGVSVQLLNSSIGTTTDANGRFSISVPNKTGVLQFSYVGFQTQTIDLATATVDLKVTMQGGGQGNLQEVVVTGIASSVRRSNLANAVSSISAKQLVGTTVQPSMDAALYGKFTGANISANSGSPGGGISVKLRGITSLIANSQPLFIVDGVYYDNSSILPGLNSVSKAAGQGSTDFQDNQSNRIADLDPEDIDRIEILKGASAAAIYGARAATGVVIVTTKRGKSGKPRIELGQSFGVQMQLRKLGMSDWTAQKVVAVFDSSRLALYNASNGKTYNYEDELFGNKGFMSNTRISVSGGNDATKYYLGYTYKDDEGIVKRTGYQKSSFRVNVDQRVTNFLDLSVSANYVNSQADRGYFNNDNTSSTMGVSYVATPNWVNLYPDANGVYPKHPFVPSNFIQTRDLITNREKVERMLVGGTGTWKILNKGIHDLRLIARGGIDQYTLNTIAIFPPDLQFQSGGNGTNGASINGTAITKGSNLSAFLLYSLDISKDLNLRTQAGLTAENFDQDHVLNTATQLIGTQTNVNQAGAVQVQQTKIKQRDRGFFVQEEANYKELVIATVGLRGDRSSRNGDANKLYYFPKGSVAFNVHKLGGGLSLGPISQIKLRGAYGESGNFAPFGAIYSPLVSVGYGGTTGSLINITRGNTNLKPETQKELEMGTDIGAWNNRVTLEFTYYRKIVDDLILKADVALSSGFQDYWQNVAKIRNTGIEIALNATIFDKKDFHWTQTTSFWQNNAIVTRLDVPAFNTGAFGATLGTYRIEEGKSPTQIVGVGRVKEDGADPNTGLAVFGDGEPDFNISSYHTLTYKNFDFSFLLHWKQGGENINLTTFLSDNFGTSHDWNDRDLDPSGQKTNGQYRLSITGTTAQPWVQNASYFRVREMGLTYTMPKEWFRNIATVRVGVSGRNLINVFDYPSYDPEVSNFGIGAISSNVEVTPYPSSKSIHFNVYVTF